MSKLVFVDTETTGIDRKTQRILEVACIQVHDRQKTGVSLHQYINPEQEVESGAYRVHGISWDKVRHEPLFAAVAQDIVDMLQGHIFVAHNAPFDLGFLNMEFERCGINFKIGRDIEVLDTLQLAKKIYPGQKNNLDALCNRLSIDRSSRVLHGALLDTELLIQVYIGMTQKQERFALKRGVTQVTDQGPLSFHRVQASEKELAQHQAYMEDIS